MPVEKSGKGLLKEIGAFTSLQCPLLAVKCFLLACRVSLVAFLEFDFKVNNLRNRR